MSRTPDQLSPKGGARRQALLLAALGAGLGASAAAPVAAAPAATREALPPLSPIAFGAFGDGVSHPISAADIAANPQWIGRYSPGAQWDAVAMQECLYAAFATTSKPGALVWNNAAPGPPNRPVHIPAGRYRIDRSLICAMAGFLIEGEGRLATTLVWGGPADQPLWLCDSAVFGLFANFGFEAASPTSQALLELDFTGARPGLKTQQVSLRDMAFVCNAQAAIGLRISKSGGAAQGDTILIDNCYFGGAAFAGLAIGMTSSQNALGITIHGGDFQGCIPHGVVVYGGQVFVQNTSFQNQNWASPRNQIATGGADVTVRGGSGVGGFSVMRDIRSESDVLVHAEGGMHVDKASLAAAGIAQWWAGANVQAGAVFSGTAGVGRSGADGRSFICVQAGVTGAAEPVWSRAPRGRSIPAGPGGLSIAQGASEATGPVSALAARVGESVVIPGAGEGGLALIATVTASTADRVTLSTAAARAVSRGQAYIGAAVVDGTARWIEVDYDSVLGAHCANLSTGAGRTRSCAVYRDCLFARPDWLRPEDEETWPAEVEWLRRPVFIDNVQVAAGGYNQPQIAHNPFTGDPAAGVLSFSLAPSRNAMVRTAAVPDQAVVDLAPLLKTGALIPLTPRRDMRLDAPVPLAGQELVLVATSLGAVSRTVRFGANFRSTGPLVTGATAGKVFVLRFISDGLAYNELSRAGPM